MTKATLTTIGTRRPDITWAEYLKDYSSKGNVKFYAIWRDVNNNGSMTISIEHARFRNGKASIQNTTKYSLRNRDYLRIYKSIQARVFEVGDLYQLQLMYDISPEFQTVLREDWNVQRWEDLVPLMWPALRGYRGTYTPDPGKMPLALRRADPYHVVRTQWSSKAAVAGVENAVDSLLHGNSLRPLFAGMSLVKNATAEQVETALTQTQWAPFPTPGMHMMFPEDALETIMNGWPHDEIKSRHIKWWDLLEGRTRHIDQALDYVGIRILKDAGGSQWQNSTLSAGTSATKSSV